MSDRDRLAADLVAALDSTRLSPFPSDQAAAMLADRLIALGWRRLDDAIAILRQQLGVTIDRQADEIARLRNLDEKRLARALNGVMTGDPLWYGRTTKAQAVQEWAAAIAKAYREDE